MKKSLAVFCVFLWGCDSPVVHAPRKFPAPTRVIIVEIVVKDEDTQYDCINRGGVWVRGDSKTYLNEIVGCIESKSPENGQPR